VFANCEIPIAGLPPLRQQRQRRWASAVNLGEFGDNNFAVRMILQNFEDVIDHAINVFLANLVEHRPDKGKAQVHTPALFL
jgi:hypothetical protein